MANEIKNTQINVRVSVEQKKALELKAQKAQKSVSDLLRDSALKK